MSKLPDEYSIYLESAEDLESVINSGRINCECIRDTPDKYMYPDRVPVSSARVVGWDAGEDYPDFTVPEWLELSKPTRGGKRKGAGRKPLKKGKRIKASITIKPELHKWAKDNKINVSDITNKALETARSKAK